jgi:hypothetical protein
MSPRKPDSSGISSEKSDNQVGHAGAPTSARAIAATAAATGGQKKLSTREQQELLRQQQEELDALEEQQLEEEREARARYRDGLAVEDMAIRVVVRKRPISTNEAGRGDRDVLEIGDGGTYRILSHVGLYVYTYCVWMCICSFMCVCVCVCARVLLGMFASVVSNRPQNWKFTLHL